MCSKEIHDSQYDDYLLKITDFIKKKVPSDSFEKPKMVPRFFSSNRKIILVYLYNYGHTIWCNAFSVYENKDKVVIFVNWVTK